jgi:hypothetical protein
MSEEQARAQSGRRGIGQSQLQHQQPLLSREYVAHQMGHTTLEMIIRQSNLPRTPDNFARNRPENGEAVLRSVRTGTRIRRKYLILKGEIVERAAGIEPATSNLGSR